MWISHKPVPKCVEVLTFLPNEVQAFSQTMSLSLTEETIGETQFERARVLFCSANEQTFEPFTVIVDSFLIIGTVKGQWFRPCLVTPIKTECHTCTKPSIILIERGTLWSDGFHDDMSASLRYPTKGQLGRSKSSTTPPTPSCRRKSLPDILC